ncbi:hypothetical protein NDU88_008142 [Pleurodeles waltl]|uniref:Uncharacterized protein n=1 Tax=Pleurodeles waltl TaxID=8319 RepID=A0AAV7PNA7_PLEWA|nr:hypothetical protein NDU88_008142 [Pleurodeles waltl]
MRHCLAKDCCACQREFQRREQRESKGLRRCSSTLLLIKENKSSMPDAVKLAVFLELRMNSDRLCPNASLRPSRIDATIN